jgi:hypothetical protein
MDREGMYRAPVDQDVAWLVNYRRGALCAVYVTIWLSAFPTPHVAIHVMNTLGFGCALLFWCALDARIRGKPFQHGLGLPLLMTWPVSMAAYLVWTRGWRGLISYALATLLAFAVAGAALLTGRLLLRP